MTLFKNETHQEIWLQHWCDRCYRERDDCPILQHALSTGRKPPQWQRNQRATTMAEQIRCDEYGVLPPVNRRKRAEPEDVPLFDVTPHDAPLVPVAGWPDKPRKKGTDHA